MEIKLRVTEKSRATIAQLFFILALGAQSAFCMDKTPDKLSTPVKRKKVISRAEQVRQLREEDAEKQRQMAAAKDKQAEEELKLLKEAESAEQRKRQEVITRVGAGRIKPDDIKELNPYLAQEICIILAEAANEDGDIRALLLSGNLENLAKKTDELSEQVTQHNTAKNNSDPEHRNTPVARAMGKLVKKTIKLKRSVVDMVDSTIKRLPEGDELRKKLESKLVEIKAKEELHKKNVAEFDELLRKNQDKEKTAKARPAIEKLKPGEKPPMNYIVEIESPNRHVRSISDEGIDRTIQEERKPSRNPQRALFKSTKVQQLEAECGNLRTQVDELTKKIDSSTKPVEDNTALKQACEDLQREVADLKKTNADANSLSTDKTKTVLTHIKQLWIPATILASMAAAAFAMNYYNGRRTAKPVKAG